MKYHGSQSTLSIIALNQQCAKLRVGRQIVEFCKFRSIVGRLNVSAKLVSSLLLGGVSQIILARVLKCPERRANEILGLPSSRPIYA